MKRGAQYEVKVTAEVPRCTGGFREHRAVLMTWDRQLRSYICPDKRCANTAYGIAETLERLGPSDEIVIINDHTEPDQYRRLEGQLREAATEIRLRGWHDVNIEVRYTEDGFVSTSVAPLKSSARRKH